MSATKSKGGGPEWFVRRGHAVRGPFSSLRVRQFVLEGKLEVEDEVSADRQLWQRLGNVAEVVPLQMREHAAPLDIADDEVGGTGAWRTIAIAMLVISLFVVGVYLAGESDTDGAVDCAAPPSPGISFEGCGFTAIDLRSAPLRGARMANIVLANGLLTEADLAEADLRYADLTAADLSYARLERAVLKGANLRLADLTNADLRGADLSFADLSRARVGGAQFEGAKLEGTIWVDGRRCQTGACPR